MKFVSVITVHPCSCQIFCCALKGWMEISIWEGAISEHPGAGHPLTTDLQLFSALSSSAAFFWPVLPQPQRWVVGEILPLP